MLRKFFAFTLALLLAATIPLGALGEGVRPGQWQHHRRGQGGRPVRLAGERRNAGEANHRNRHQADGQRYDFYHEYHHHQGDGRGHE